MPEETGGPQGSEDRGAAMSGIVASFLGLLRDNWLFLLIIGALAVAFLVLRTPASDVASLAEVDAILTSGQPTVVEVFSNT